MIHISITSCELVHLKVTHAQTVEYRLSHPCGREKDKDKEGKRERERGHTNETAYVCVWSNAMYLYLLTWWLIYRQCGRHAIVASDDWCSLCPLLVVMLRLACKELEKSAGLITPSEQTFTVMSLVFYSACRVQWPSRFVNCSASPIVRLFYG